jgi:hypothetical protein
MKNLARRPSVAVIDRERLFSAVVTDAAEIRDTEAQRGPRHRFAADLD